MLEILAARLGDLGIGRQIIIAVGHADAALREVSDVAVGLLVVLVDEGGERRADAHAVGAGEERR